MQPQKYPKGEAGLYISLQPAAECKESPTKRGFQPKEVSRKDDDTPYGFYKEEPWTGVR